VASVLAEVWTEARTDVDTATPTAASLSAEAALFRFFAATFAPGVETVADVAARVGVNEAALANWFVRRGLPSAERYLAAARLVRAAWTGETPAPSVVTAAVRSMAAEFPGCDAPNVHHQNVRRLRRMAVLLASVPPGRAAGRRVLQGYRTALMIPFWPTLATFDPARDPVRRAGR
jgi:AcrR family transcriptional regulator